MKKSSSEEIKLNVVSSSELQNLDDSLLEGVNGGYCSSPESLKIGTIIYLRLYMQIGTLDYVNNLTSIYFNAEVRVDAEQVSQGNSYGKRYIGTILRISVPDTFGAVGRTVSFSLACVGDSPKYAF